MPGRGTAITWQQIQGVNDTEPHGIWPMPIFRPRRPTYARRRARSFASACSNCLYNPKHF
ncbi:hypothetical protein A1355_18060 [Methylomonas koyamae]|uniref:Uncharacterized protein n=1 Tax=Methylomonas koyamae TaxID=702114 RepID=A0A177PCF0_9GAMM|nr:hypothetical protein A1355_18060 [Methylomonas koyamae]